MQIPNWKSCNSGACTASAHDGETPYSYDSISHSLCTLCLFSKKTCHSLLFGREGCGGVRFLIESSHGTLLREFVAQLQITVFVLLGV
eukprot:5453862-Amphidinium_carterae.1